MRQLLFAFALLVAAYPAHAIEYPAPRLHEITFSPGEPGTGGTVRLHLDGRVTAFSDPRKVDERTVEVTLYNVRPAPDMQRGDPQLPVEAYRTRTNRGHLILVFDLSGPVRGDVYRDPTNHDLVVTLSPSTPLPPPSPRVATEVVSTPVGSDAGSAPAPSTAISDAASRWRLDRIVIDAGHGGRDPGATVGRIREKDVVLPIALKLGQYLENRLGVEVIYTRRGDRFVELRERGRIANRNEADLFISIHANWAANRSAHGTETFFLGMNKGDNAQRVIERENSVIQLETDQEHYDQFDQAALVRLQLAQSAFLRKSEELASRIEHQFQNRVQRKSRGVKEGNLQVLWAAASPAVLVEVGFISNASEARFLRSQAGVDYMASAIYRAVRDYKDAYEESLSLSADR